MPLPFPANNRIKNILTWEVNDLRVKRDNWAVVVKRETELRPRNIKVAKMLAISQNWFNDPPQYTAVHSGACTDLNRGSKLRATWDPVICLISADASNFQVLLTNCDQTAFKRSC